MLSCSKFLLNGIPLPLKIVGFKAIPGVWKTYSPELNGLRSMYGASDTSICRIRPHHHLGNRSSLTDKVSCSRIRRDNDR